MDGIIPRVVVPMLYSTCSHALTRATRVHYIDALSFANGIGDRSRICVAHCCWDVQNDGTWRIEDRLNDELVRTCWPNDTVHIVQGEPVNGIIAEAKSIRRILSGVGIVDPESLLVIMGQALARPAHLIYSLVFPNTNIYVKGFQFDYECQHDQPIYDRRLPWRWFVTCVLHYYFIRVCGLKFVSRFSRARSTELKD